VPTTAAGLFIFAALLAPGFIHYVQRRRAVPQRTLSPLVETATLTTVSIVTNLVALGFFALIRTALPEHTPDVQRLLLEGKEYAAARTGYLFGWAALLLGLSCVLAFIIGVRPHWIARFTERFAPAIVDVSAWYHAFEDGPENAKVYLGCDLKDGTYVAGYLDWYSTEVAETADRDFVIAEPIEIRMPGDADSALVDFPRVVISARDTARLYVSYVAEEPSGL